jgi:hypothetical protein
MRVAEHPRREQLDMAAHLRLGVQAGAGVIEIDHAVRIKASVVARPQRIEMRRRSVLRILREELVEH